MIVLFPLLLKATFQLLPQVGFDLDEPSFQLLAFSHFFANQLATTLELFV